MPRRKQSEEPVVREARGSAAKFFVGLIVSAVLVVGGAVLIGKSDDGQIDVASAIQSANRDFVANGGDPNAQVGTVDQAFQNMPNGGLVAQENQPVTPEPIVEPAATTTDGVATSTDSGTTEGEPNPETSDTSDESSGNTGEGDGAPSDSTSSEEAPPSEGEQQQI